MSAALTLPVDEAMLARIDALAEERSIPRDDLLRFALTDFLDAQAECSDELLPWQEELVREGEADAAAGRFASDEEIARIAATYRT